jgi:hypothetical protein
MAEYSPQQLQMLKAQGINPQAPSARSVAGPQTMQSQGLNLQGQLTHPDRPYTFSKPSVDNPAAVQAAQAGSAPGAAGAQAQGPYQAMNPLAVNLFYSQAIAPMMQSLAQQLQGSNADFSKQMQNNPLAKFVPPQLQAIFNQQNARQGAEQNQLVTSMMNSAMNAPALDALMQQVNAGRQAAVQDYEKQLYLESQGGAGNPFATSGPGGQPLSAQQIVDQATQKMNG